ncbi:Gpi16 subunit, GPI transamidase component [Martensiomyces pterosporus]|nr:Gpi16 subunit, GPI transamidase component [Martensiomyces pterosporus]
MRASWWALAAAAGIGTGVLAGNPATTGGKLSSEKETFTEDLLIKPLPDGKVLLHFEFGMQRPAAAQSNETLHHYHLFPRQIGEIALRYKVEELHLAFTQGSWRPEKWGYPSVNTQGIGAEIRARISGDNSRSGDLAESDRNWKGLANALSGVFCASLNFVDESSTSKPQLTFGQQMPSSGVVRHGYLPRENVCTENLTPWIKQLPCQAKSGIGALLNPYRLYNMHFHSMGMSLEPEHVGGGRSVLVYKQHLAVVLDPRAFGLGSQWTLSQLMDRPLAPACPVAERSTVRVVMPKTGLKVAPEPGSLASPANHAIRAYDLKKQPIADVTLTFDPTAMSSSAAAAAAVPPAIVAHRYVTGHGGSSGGVETMITNNGGKDIEVSYLDTLPWYLRLYTHTLTIKSALPDGSTKKLQPSSLILTPAVDRGRPSSIELALVLPANSRTTLRYSFDKGFLKYTEHPPDANRGFNIGPAIIAYTAGDVDESDNYPLQCAIRSVLSSKTGACTTRVYTELFLASLPTPDFSMPYNVITFTCTILALFFGRMFNLLTRDFAVLRSPDA